MEIKKAKPSVAPDIKPALGSSKIVEFIESVKAEFKKISWTTPEELRVYTQVVVIGTFIFGMLVYCVDLLIQGVLNSLSLLVHML